MQICMPIPILVCTMAFIRLKRGHFMNQTTLEQLYRYCQNKPGSQPSITFGEQRPSYHLLGGFGYSFVHFLLMTSPPQLHLRCKPHVIDLYKDRLSLQLTGKRPTPDHAWYWADILLDGSFTQEELFSLIDDSYRLCIDQLNPHERQLLTLIEQSSSYDEAFNALFDLNRLSHRQSEAMALAQMALGLHTHPIAHNTLRPCQSKIGGLPDLPESWLYPVFDGQPLAFLAQINLSELAPIEDSPLPVKGMLYFFSMYGCQLNDGDPIPGLPWERSKEPGFSQVLFFEGDLTGCKPASQPTGIRIFKEASITSFPVLTYPRARDYCRDPAMAALNWSEKEFEHFDDLFLFDLPFILSKQGESIDHYQFHHQLLGYPGVIQWPVTQPDTQLLFQLNCDEHASDMTWGDGGSIYFTIPRSDLERRNFRSIQSDFQSG